MEYNILVIGQPGESKSTFINVIANYVKFGSLDEAMAGKWQEPIPSSVARTQSVYTFRRNSMLIRLIDITSEDEHLNNNDIIREMRQCLVNYPKLHAIVAVVDEILEQYNISSNRYFDQNLLVLLTIIPKSACNNVVLCFTKSWIWKISNETFAKLQSNIGTYSTITPYRGKNVLILDRSILECSVAQKQGNTFSDEPLNQYKISWIETSEQIQTMIEYVASSEPCEMTNVVELIEAILVLGLCMHIGLDYITGSDIAIEETGFCPVDYLKRNTTEYEQIEQIFLKLWALWLHLTVVSDDDETLSGFYDLIIYFNDFVYMIDLSINDSGKTYSINRKRKNAQLIKIFKKLRQVSLNRQSVEAKLSQCSATEYFHELFNELAKLPVTGSYFANLLSVLRPDELRHVVSILTENNLLLVECAGTAKPDLTNVTFYSGGLTSRTVNLVLNNSSTLLGITQSDIQFAIDYIDSLIKHNFDNLLPVIRDYPPMEEVIRNRQKGEDCFCLIL